MLYILYKVIISIQGYIMGHRRGQTPPHLPPNIFHSVIGYSDHLKKYYFNSPPFFPFWPFMCCPWFGFIEPKIVNFIEKKILTFLIHDLVAKMKSSLCWKNNKVVKQGMRKRARNMKTKVKRGQRGGRGGRPFFNIIYSYGWGQRS